MPTARGAPTVEADRQVFSLLRQNRRWRATNQASVYYQLNPHDPNHERRIQVIGDDYAKAGRK